MAPFRILVIEKDRGTASILRKYFDNQLYVLTVVSTGRTALKQIEKKHFDAILLNPDLPDMDGLDICKILRTHVMTKQVPIILLFHEYDRDQILRGLEWGADTYYNVLRGKKNKIYIDLPGLRMHMQSMSNRTPNTLWDPITGLPAKQLVDEYLKDNMERKDCALLNIGIVSFREFEDKYGFIAGYQLLRQVGKSISDVLIELGGQDTFVGFLGEEAFAVVINERYVQMVINRLKTRFVEDVSTLNNLFVQDKISDTAEDGFITREISHQIRLAIGYVLFGDGQFSDIQEMTALSAVRRENDDVSILPASERLIEHQVKQMQGHSNWALMDLLIRNYEAYRDVYTSVDASEILLLTQKLINEVVCELGKDSSYFIDNAFENHFWIVTISENARLVRERLKSRFTEISHSRYYYIHQQEGFIRLKNGEKVPLMDLAVGIFIPEKVADPKAILKKAEDARKQDI